MNATLLLALLLLAVARATPLDSAALHQDAVPEPTSEAEEEGGSSSLTRIAPPVFIIFVILVGAGIAFWYWRRSRHQVFVEAVMTDGANPNNNRSAFNDQL